MKMLPLINESDDKLKKIKEAKHFVDRLGSAMLRNNVSDRSSEIIDIIIEMGDSDIDWNKDLRGHYREDFKGLLRAVETHLKLWKDGKRSINESDYSKVKNSLMRSKSIPSEMKEKIIKYLSSGSTYKEGGHLHGLTKPKELMNKTPKADGVSMGADKNGFFVYTHRARSDSHESPEKIPIKEIDFIESTG